jgi:hypothetical protein
MQDLDYIILLTQEDPDNKKQKELAFQISKLVLWLLDNYKTPVKLINTFIPLTSPKPLNLSDSVNKTIFNEETLHKGSNVKITAVFESGTPYRPNYYQLVDICYDFTVLDPAVQDIYWNGCTVDHAGRLLNNGVIIYLGIQEHFSEICYNILQNYLSGTVRENLHYLSKTRLRIRDVIIEIKLFIEKDSHFSALLKNEPYNPEINLLIETYFLVKLYSTFQKYFDKTKTPLEEFSASLTPIIKDIFYYEEERFYNGPRSSHEITDKINGYLSLFRESLFRESLKAQAPG